MMRCTALLGSASRLAGGVFEAVRGLSRGLVETGVDVDVLGGADAFSESDEAAWHPARVRAFPTLGPRSFGYARGLREFLQAMPIDILHLHGMWMYISIACHQRHRAGVPYVMSIHGYLDPWALRHSRWKKRLARLLYEDRTLRDAACLHSLSALETKSIRAFGSHLPVCEIPNGVALPGGLEGLSPWDGLVPRGARVLLYLGRLHAKKRVTELVLGWAQATREAADGEDWWLVVVGWDQGQGGAIRALLDELRPRNVVLLDAQFGDAKGRAYRDAAAFVLPSVSEGLPATVLEAWSWRLPVLMTDACNLPEGFAAGAALSISSDPDGIARGLRQLFNMSDADRREMGGRGRALVERRFEWRRIAAQFRSVYEWILGGGAAPACVLR